MNKTKKCQHGQEQYSCDDCTNELFWQEEDNKRRLALAAKALDEHQRKRSIRDTRVHCICTWYSKTPDRTAGEAEHRDHVAEQVLTKVEQGTVHLAHIETTQWDGTAEAATSIIEWLEDHGITGNYTCSEALGCEGEDTHWIQFDMGLGSVVYRVNKDDWIVSSATGHFYAVPNDVFEAVYYESGVK